MEALYGAYENFDHDTVLEIRAPFIADEAPHGGMTAEQVTEEYTQLLKAGKLQPMPELTITSHRGGKLFRVIGPDGNPPVRILMEHDPAKGTIRTGEWWSMIGGKWRLVR